MFPVGDITKTEVKRIAADNGLQKFAEKKESVGICFIGTRDFQDFITEVSNNFSLFIILSFRKCIFPFVFSILKTILEILWI